nr:unnamed protein product [Digitaria exilis]
MDGGGGAAAAEDEDDELASMEEKPAAAGTTTRDLELSCYLAATASAAEGFRMGGFHWLRPGAASRAPEPPRSSGLVVVGYSGDRASPSVSSRGLPGP